MVMDDRFKQYRKTNIAEMRPYEKGEDLSHISVSIVDNPEEDMGMIARNPKKHEDQWYVTKEYFEDNFEVYNPWFFYLVPPLKPQASLAVF